VTKIIADASIEFGLQLDAYIKHFGLERTDIGNLLSTTVRSIDKIIAGEKGVVLKTMEKIAGFFGIAYYEMANPNFPFPTLEELPQSTRDIILNRENSDKPDRDYEAQFTKHLEDIVKGNFLREEHTAKQVLGEMPKEIRENEKYKPARITDAFKNGALAKFVVVVGKRGREYVFQLREYALKGN